VLFDSEVAEEIMDKQCQYFDLPILFKIDQTLYFWKAVRFAVGHCYLEIPDVRQEEAVVRVECVLPR